MSVNKDRPHVLVLPEDDANLRIANGFHLQVDRYRQMQVLPVAGGWMEVLNFCVAAREGNGPLSGAIHGAVNRLRW